MPVCAASLVVVALDGFFHNSISKIFLFSELLPTSGSPCAASSRASFAAFSFAFFYLELLLKWAAPLHLLRPRATRTACFRDSWQVDLAAYLMKLHASVERKCEYTLSSQRPRASSTPRASPSHAPQ